MHVREQILESHLCQNKKILQNKANVSIKEADLFIVARFISFLIDSTLNNYTAKLYYLCFVRYNRGSVNLTIISAFLISLSA
jgi:hypothetical protein